MLITRLVSRSSWVALVCVCIMLATFAGRLAAQTASQSGLDKGQYIPNIWVDPNGSLGRFGEANDGRRDRRVHDPACDA